MTIDLKAIRERRWPLSFHHRAAKTPAEMREVIETLEALRKEADKCPGELAVLDLRNQVWANVECYGHEYVAQLLALIDHLMGEIYGIAACAREADVPAHAWNRIEHALNLLRDLDGDARGGGPR